MPKTAASSQALTHPLEPSEADSIHDMGMLLSRAIARGQRFDDENPEFSYERRKEQFEQKLRNLRKLGK